MLGVFILFFKLPVFFPLFAGWINYASEPSEETFIEAAKMHLQKAYQEEFVIDQINRHPLQRYELKAHPKQDPRISFDVVLSIQDPPQIKDNYYVKKVVDSIVTEELPNDRYVKSIQNIQPDISSPAYPLFKDAQTYQEMMQKYPEKISYSLYLYGFLQKNVDWKTEGVHLVNVFHKLNASRIQDTTVHIAFQEVSNLATGIADAKKEIESIGVPALINKNKDKLTFHCKIKGSEGINSVQNILNKCGQ